jgi:hypothetical protein
MAIDAALGLGGLRSGVCTSSTRPAAPYDGQVIYETDTDKAYSWDGTAWTHLGPQGLVAYATQTTGQASITTEVDLTSLSVTWTAVSNRRYLIMFKVELTASVADGSFTVKLTDSSNTQISRATDACLTTASRTAQSSLVVTGLSGSITRKLRMAKVGGSGSLSTNSDATNPSHLTVIDLAVMT